MALGVIGELSSLPRGTRGRRSRDGRLIRITRGWHVAVLHSTLPSLRSVPSQFHPALSAPSPTCHGQFLSRRIRLPSPIASGRGERRRDTHVEARAYGGRVLGGEGTLNSVAERIPLGTVNDRDSNSPPSSLHRASRNSTEIPRTAP